jgi:phage terminase large subunit GpA-like protein
MLPVIDKINKIIRVGLSPLKPAEKIPGSDWADKYYYLSEESSSNAGKWNNYPYQIGILDWMTDDRVKQVNIKKSRRIGYTEMLKIAIAYYIIEKRRNIALWQPTDENARDFVTDSIDPMLRDLPALGKKLLCKPGARSKYNTTTKKVFEGAILDIKGGRSAGNFRRMTKDVVGYDECDVFLPDIEGEGNCFKLGDGRTDDAAYPKSIRGSTPKLKETSLIESAVQSSDVILYRFIKCNNCGGMFRLLFTDFNFDDATFPCSKCGEYVDYKKYPHMDKHGHWANADQTIIYDEILKIFKNEKGNRLRTPESVGVVIWCAYSYLKSWRYFLQEWTEAIKRAEAGDITLVKTAVNTLRGETWETKVEKVDPKELIEFTENYNIVNSIPDGVLVITMGVDVQGDRLELEIVGHGLRGETWGLGYFELPGDIIIGDVFKDLDNQYVRKFKREDGKILKISCMMIDAGYETEHVYKYTRVRKSHNVFAIMGTNKGMVPNKPVFKGEKSRKTILYTSNADVCKRTIFKRFKISEPGPGYCHFPKSYGYKYFQGLTNAVMYKKYRNGVFIGYGWRKKNAGMPDEPLDCRHYAIAAFNKLDLKL